MYRTISAFEIENIFAKYKTGGRREVSREEIKEAYMEKYKTSDLEAEKVIIRGLAQLLEDGVIRKIGDDTFEYLL